MLRDDKNVGRIHASANKRVEIIMSQISHLRKKQTLVMPLEFHKSPARFYFATSTLAERNLKGAIDADLVDTRIANVNLTDLRA